MSANLTIDATFENGVFVPKRPVCDLSEHEDVQLSIVVNKSRPKMRLPDGPYADESYPPPFDLPHQGESKVVTSVQGTVRAVDPAALADLLEQKCSQG
jgi:hypothetical protein